jgi:hypothetical protein
MLLNEDPTLTLKCITTIKALFLYFNLCLSVKCNSLLCSFSPMPFLTNLLTLVGSLMKDNIYFNIK